MTPEQEQSLTEKLTQLECPDFEIMPGEDDVLMLYIQGSFICGALYALSLPDEQLKALIIPLIDETVQVAGGQ